MTTFTTLRKATLALAAFATLAGASLASTQASAAGYHVSDEAYTANFPGWDTLNIRAWPAAHSRKVADIPVHRSVFVERCIIKQGADWCKIRKGWKYGWVNGRYLMKAGHDFSYRHPWY
ncbi:MAG: hypothetical protein AAGF28_13125 [Pseudomonadota bacterium]